MLLALPTPEVYNRKTLKGILLTSYRQQKPVVSYSPAHVKSGALAAIYASPKNIGEQLVSLIEQVLDNENARRKPFYYASKFDIEVNEQVAKSLNLDLPSREILLQKMQSGSTE